MATKLFPLGECEVSYTPKNGSLVKIDKTLKEDDCSLSIVTDGYKVEVDQLEGPYIYTTKLSEATFKCSVLVDLDQLEKLTNLADKGRTGMAISTAGKSMQVGKLEIHPLAAGTSKDFDIMAPKAFLKSDFNISFKKEGLAKLDLTFELAADEESGSATYRKILTIGQPYAAMAMAAATVSHEEPGTGLKAKE